MQEDKNTKPKNRSLNLPFSFNIILAIISIIVGVDLNAHNLLPTLAYMFLLLPLAFATHVIVFFNSIVVKSKKGIIFFIFSTITAFIIFYPAINDMNEDGLSSDGYINYSNFKCKDTNITSHVPIHIYSYKSGRGGGIMDQITPYFGSMIEMFDEIREDASTISHTVYPIGTTFNIQRLYGHCSFGNGCYDDFLVKSEDGIFFWLSASDISVNSCSFRYDYSINYQDLNATNGQEINIKNEHVSSSPIIRYNPKKDYDEIIDYFKNHTINNLKKSTVTIYIPEYNNKNKYIYKYILNIIKRYFPKELSYNINMQTSNIDFFMIKNEKVANNGEKEYFYPYNCQKFIKNPYGCLDKLPSWLKNPYPLKTIIYDKIVTKKNIKHLMLKEPYILILNTKYPGYDHIIRTYNFIKNLKESIGKVLIYKPDESMKNYFKKGGFYVIDTNLTIKVYGDFYLKKFIDNAKKYFLPKDKLIN